MRRGFLLLLLAAVAGAEDADYGVEALRRRVEELRPDVEAALGAPLGDPVEIRVSPPETLKELLTQELEAQRSRIEGGPRGEKLRETCAQEAAFASLILFAKVEPASGVMHVCPENFRRIAAAGDDWKGLLSQGVLDTVLLHEMVHVFQARRLELARFIGAPPSIEQLTARAAVIEGHAQYVGRLAAKRRGLEAALELMDRAHTDVSSSVEDPALRHFAEILGANFAFAYVDGERLVAAVVTKLGYEKAVERLFASPPETLRAVSNPGEYLDPPAPDSSLEELASLVQRLLAERGGTTQVVPFPIPALRAAMAPAGPEVTERAMRAFDKGLAIVAAGDPQVTVAFLRGRDEEAARILYDADVATSKAKDDLFGKPGLQIRIVSAAYRDISVGGADGIEARKSVEVALGSRQWVETVVVRRGALVLEAMIADASGPTGQVARLAREVLELLRGAETADPWDGTKGEDARRALLDALGDPHWGVRWRAVRNLARRKADPEVGAALVGMLRDPDASVSCDALRGLLRHGWLTNLAREEIDALAAHADWEVRLAYLRAMAEHDGQASRLLAVLADSHPGIRAYAIEKLDDMGVQIPWERLRAGIEDADGDVRLAAIRALGFRNPPEARDVLLRALGDEDPRIRDAAVVRLGQWAGEALVLEALIRALGDESGTVRSTAAREIRDAGKGAAAAVPALVLLLDDEFVREAAAETLGRIGVADEEAMRKLEGLLQGDDLGLRFEAARALRRLGRDPRDLAPVFAEASRKGKDWERDDAVEELGRLGEGGRPHVADLVAALEDEQPRVREKASEALGNLGAIAEEALPALEALGGAKEEPEPGPDVIGLGRGPSDAEVRRAAREAARKIRAALASGQR